MNRWLHPWFSGLLAERRLCLAVVAGTGLLAIAYRFGISLWRCPFFTVTGVPCPGCGLTRGVMALANGDWRAALAFHPFSPFFLLGWLIMASTAVMPQPTRLRFIERVRLLERRTLFPAILLILFAGYGLTRMVVCCFDHIDNPGKPSGFPTSTTCFKYHDSTSRLHPRPR